MQLNEWQKASRNRSSQGLSKKMKRRGIQGTVSWSLRRSWGCLLLLVCFGRTYRALEFEEKDGSTVKWRERGIRKRERIQGSTKGGPSRDLSWFQLGLRRWHLQFPRISLKNGSCTRIRAEIIPRPKGHEIEYPTPRVRTVLSDVFSPTWFKKVQLVEMMNWTRMTVIAAKKICAN